MKISRLAVLMLMSLLISSSIMMGGCTSAAKKPAQPPSSTPVPTNPIPTNPTPTPTTPNATTPTQPSALDVANQAAMVASKIMGVNKATAVVADNVIYVGLDLDANMDKTKSAAIEKNVMDTVTKMEAGYTVKVTSDIKTVAAIKTVAQGLVQGKTISSFKTEMNMILTNMNPKSKLQ